MNLRSYLKRQTLTKILETRKEKEESTLLIEALKTKTPQLNEVFKNTEILKYFAETPQKTQEKPQLNEVLMNTEKPQIFCGNVSKKKKKPQLNEVYKNTETTHKFK